MSKKTKEVPSAFDDVFGKLGFDNPVPHTESTDMDNIDNTADVEPSNKDDEPGKVPVDKNKVDKFEDTSDIPEEILKNDVASNDVPQEPNPDTNEPTDEDITEATQIGAMFDAVVEKFGWDVSEIPEEERPVSVDDFVNYIHDVVEHNSQPEYADDRIAKLDEYVKNGGKFEDFYTVQTDAMSYDDVDLEDETTQRTVIREFLRVSGYDEEQIQSKLRRYDANDMLEEEAQDALSRLKVIRQQEIERLQNEQEASRKAQEESQKRFVAEVSTQINDITDIRGIAIPKEDRKALYEYIFRTDANGMTQYQKDFNKNLSKNLIESAYFTMKADAFVSEAKKVGQTTAAQKLRQMLRNSSRNRTTSAANEEKQRPAWEIASKFL